ncbi:uncharacterized protein [Rutidosis leptorrhynchoides]|uniref:uncharacterized protein n=1 Tax=Rutidosis leptorrhynchoides TaxID=125765 RepID=UPI003A9A3E6A
MLFSNAKWQKKFGNVSMIESIDHALFQCKVAKEIWQREYNWWLLTHPASLNVSNAFLGNNSGLSSPRAQSLWQVVEWVTGYLIWENRNSVTFNNKSSSTPLILNEIQLLSFEWIRNRSKGFSIEWRTWISNPSLLDGVTYNKTGIS